MIQEFRDFIAKGNVLDLAVAVLIGAAFGKIVDSFVKDILTPVLAPLTPGRDFAAYKLGPFGVGNFINNVLQFLIIAFVLFLIVKAVKRIQRPVAVEPPAPVVDLAAENVAQNQQIIALLEQIVAKS
ncbi:MAG: large conductance mechanosensitive channel protein MscL [Abitibacteriaceae bacterium]|nr:large conductance mechanosensitive channel protein MscL [Abditibacteriaceae bacterium]MBV9865798.1 large conductance mechanosensitive channel protein MscL [Abditibacteriaceae bacterium]